MSHRLSSLAAALTLTLAGLGLAACVPPAPSGGPPLKPAQVEAIEGSAVKRVVLTEKAAQRLDIQTAVVVEEAVVRTRAVGGEVIAAPAAEVRVRVRLNQSDLDQVDQDQPVFVRPLDDEDDDDEDDGVEVDEVDGPDDEDDDAADGGGTLFYAPLDDAQRFTPGERVWVELTLAGGGALRRVVPYAAILYDLDGNTWVYTNPEPLVFVRQAVSVDFIEDGLVYLTDGPAAGTRVVTVGGAELYGTEVGLSK